MVFFQLCQRVFKTREYILLNCNRIKELVCQVSKVCKLLRFFCRETGSKLVYTSLRPASRKVQFLNLVLDVLENLSWSTSIDVFVFEYLLTKNGAVFDTLDIVVKRCERIAESFHRHVKFGLDLSDCSFHLCNLRLNLGRLHVVVSSCLSDLFFEALNSAFHLFDLQCCRRIVFFSRQHIDKELALT